MNPAHQEKLKTFKVLLLDADGVFFDGYESRTVLSDGSVTINKRRHYHDGQGISFLRHLGIRIKFVSGEGDPLMGIVEKLNSLPSAVNGIWLPIEVSSGQIGQGSKLSTIETWLAENNFHWSDCVYIGDDVNDYESMKKISISGGLAIAPANATRKIKEVADIVLTREGGHGAIREFAEMVLDARGLDEGSIPVA